MRHQALIEDGRVAHGPVLVAAGLKSPGLLEEGFQPFAQLSLVDVLLVHEADYAMQFHHETDARLNQVELFEDRLGLRQRVGQARYGVYTVDDHRHKAAVLDVVAVLALLR